MERCTNAARYTAKRKPTCGCRACSRAWRAAEKHRRDHAAILAARSGSYGAGGLMTESEIYLALAARGY